MTQKVQYNLVTAEKIDDKIKVTIQSKDNKDNSYIFILDFDGEQKDTTKAAKWLVDAMTDSAEISVIIAVEKLRRGEV